MVMLKSYDEVVFELPDEAAMQAKTLRRMIEDDCAGGIIPIKNVSANVLERVIAYCMQQVDADFLSKSTEARREWEKQFVDVDQETLYDLLMAANFLEIDDLLDLTCEEVAGMIKGKNPEEIRQTLNIENDFTAEEEAEICREIRWAFDC